MNSDLVDLPPRTLFEKVMRLPLGCWFGGFCLLTVAMVCWVGSSLFGRDAGVSSQAVAATEVATASSPAGSESEPIEEIESSRHEVSAVDPQAPSISAGTSQSESAGQGSIAPPGNDRPSGAQDSPAGDRRPDISPAQVAPSATALSWSIPVVGVEPAELRNSFDDPRSGGRRHRAIDIMAPRHRPVVAALDGKIVRISETPRGGRSVHQRSASGSYILFYAHLESIEAELEEGQEVRRGEPIGTVGNSGNARDTSPHLHFAVSAVEKKQRWWRGEPIDPYPILLGAEPVRPSS